MKIDRVWSMPSRWTFSIKPFKELLDVQVGTGMFDEKGLWADPFCGKYSPAQITNDLNEELKATYHLDALEFLKSQPSNHFDGVLYDPPYSFRQASECYKMRGLPAKLVTSKKYWMECKDEVARITRPGGKVVCFGWNSNGMGKNRGFVMTQLLVCAHGGSMNDTICTVELKNGS